MTRALIFLLLAGVVMFGSMGVADAAPDIEMVLVKGGCFQMGDTFGDGSNDEKPVHEVCVNDFYIGKYLVTQEQWQAVMGNNPSEFKGERRPVGEVSWDDAQQFIVKLNAQAGRNYRLPTEAEWEYAARSGGKREKWAGTSDENSLRKYAWYKENSGEKTHVVGTKKPNGLGIYDMSGNLWEWCQDWYGAVYYEESPKDNPQGPKTGTSRVLRGGSWCLDTWNMRAAKRYGDGPSYRNSGNCFRLAASSQ
jgi:formylglycine-generating enzyme required for sulfatase activity